MAQSLNATILHQCTEPGCVSLKGNAPNLCVDQNSPFEDTLAQPS